MPNGQNLKAEGAFMRDRLIAMRNTVLALAVVSSLALAQPDPAVATGRKALDYLLAERYTELSTMFNAAMKENLTMDVLRGRVHVELSGFGKAGNIGSPVVAHENDFTLVSFPVDFALTKVTVEFRLEKSGELAAIHFRPADADVPTWHHPPYSKPEAFVERTVTIGTAPWKLDGTLTVPAGKGPFPAVILVHGPGPNDRDETLRANKVFADIAEGLSSRGIAVLRYDKRTRVYGRQMSETGFTLREETIDDALAAAVFLRAQPEINSGRIYLLGHSLGGYAAPRIAREDRKLAGLIFLAANARPVQEVILEQTEYMGSTGAVPAEEIQKRLDLLKAETAKVKALAPGADNPPVVMGLPSAWLVDVKDYDPAALASHLTISILVLQGERDFQVSMKDFGRWKAALGGRANVSFHTYPELNHLFMAGTGKSLPTEYLVPSNVAPAVIDDIAKWIAAAKP
jgi:dienelactone hydrolase